LFDRLDFVYMPSSDVAADVDHFVTALGGELAFAIERFGTRVAMVRLGAGPGVLVAEHLEGDRPVLVFRVTDLEATIAELEERGAGVGERFGIPPGEGVLLELPGPQRMAVYEETRPERMASIEGRRDF
jgi:hypothetical protein